MRAGQHSSGQNHTVSGARQRLPGNALVWMGSYAGAAWLLSSEALTPVVPGTNFSLMSLPEALLAAALMIRPWKEAPVYAVIHAIAGLLFHAGIHYPGYATVRIAIEIAEAWMIAWMLLRVFLPRFGDPLVLALYPVAVLCVTAIGGAILLVATSLLPVIGIASPPTLLMIPARTWQHWWLGHACAYLVLAGPIAVMVTMRRRLIRTLTQPGPERRTF